MRKVIFAIFVVIGFLSFIMLIGSAGALEVETADVAKCSKQMWIWLGVFVVSCITAKLVGGDNE